MILTADIKKTQKLRKAVKYKECIIIKFSERYPMIAGSDGFDWSDVSFNTRMSTRYSPDEVKLTNKEMNRKWNIIGVISEEHLIISRKEKCYVINYNAVEIIKPINLRSEYELDPNLFKI